MHLEMELDTTIFNYITEEAKRLGLTPEELIRHTLGQGFGRFKAGPASTPIFPAPASTRWEADPSIYSTTPVVFGPEMVAQLRVLAAVFGYFKCPGCTQPVSQEDARVGKCSKCYALFPDA